MLPSLKTPMAFSCCFLPGAFVNISGLAGLTCRDTSVAEGNVDVFALTTVNGFDPETNGEPATALKAPVAPLML